MEATSVFFAVRSGNDVIPTVGESERCFLCGLLPGYIAGRWRPPIVIELVFDSGAAAVSYQLVSNGKGSHKELVAAILVKESKSQLRVSIRAEQQPSEKSCSCNSEL
jgi:hypothetical protein